MDLPFCAGSILEREGHPIYLFPDEDSLELNEEFKRKYPGPYHLIIPDGNWTQAKKVKSREEKFSSLQTVKLPPHLVAEYKLRKAPRPQWVSTFEAAAYSLGILESHDIQTAMLTFFRKWVNATLCARSGDFSSVM
jgi:DTW domain-containing protein YfiP